MKCNLCGSLKFLPVKSRSNAKCASCGSLERTRLLWMYLKKIGLRSDMQVLHFAPEKGIYRQLSLILKPENYQVTDIEPGRYKFVKQIRKLDLCSLEHLKSNVFDLIIHSHVLEHVPCNLAYTLFHLHRALKEEGMHVCVIPFVSGYYDECYGGIGIEERTSRFGQSDHVRKFGREDIDSSIGKIINIPKFNALNDFTEVELKQANVPKEAWQGYTGNTVLRLKKYDMKLLQHPVGI